MRKLLLATAMCAVFGLFAACGGGKTKPKIDPAQDQAGADDIVLRASDLPDGFLPKAKDAAPESSVVGRVETDVTACAESVTAKRASQDDPHRTARSQATFDKGDDRKAVEIAGSVEVYDSPDVVSSRLGDARSHLKGSELASCVERAFKDESTRRAGSVSTVEHKSVALDDAGDESTGIIFTAEVAITNATIHLNFEVGFARLGRVDLGAHAFWLEATQDKDPLATALRSMARRS